MWKGIDYETHRPYFDYTHSLISGKWKRKIIYHLSYHKVLRYNKLRRTLDKITHKTLSQTLKEMIQDGLVERREFPQIPPKVEYRLTEKGTELLDVIIVMCKWGEKYHQ